MKVLAAVVLAFALSDGPDKDPKTAKHVQTERSGCLDQSGEQYVLKSETDMTVVTKLKGKGFSDDNFARYLGHKVLVQGTSKGDVFEVVKVTKLAETCGRP
ncbi:MAG TPA: hypothetical protein VEX68_07860 [Bryobacteraceae bacterium]|nr:hypothetical protein [Bryobacteraceae bacterium]